jgi:serine/threonine-protein kinase
MTRVGTAVGVYEIVAPLGAGGMGEVYRARDTKLGRDVALKILPAAFALDPDRLARFKREAQVLASLNHPHIAAIYGFEDAGDVHALVLELVEGPTLADRIAQGPLPLDEALPIARQIAEALDAAHEQGIIHRDLKPANIKVRADGTAKVLDFGLAKLADAPGAGSAVGDALSLSPTITSPAVTMAGTILGTAAYMAPEQAKGRPADKRSDVWAFGCVLYEMLTGKRAFDGEDVSETLAAVLKSQPDWTAWPGDTPIAVRVLVERCLAKDRRERVADVSTARFVLKDASSFIQRATPIPVAPPLRPVWRRAIPIAAAVALSAVVTSLAWWTQRPALATPTVKQFSDRLKDGERFIDVFMPLVAVSPDGEQIAYVANRSIHVRKLSEPAYRIIPGTETKGFLGAPVFSPDGTSIAFWAQVGTSSGEARQANAFLLKRVALNGGAPIPICPTSLPFGVSWDASGIVFGQNLGSDRGIMRCSPDGGTPEMLVHVKSDEMAQSPQMLPGGDAVMFTLAKGFTRDTAVLTSDFWDNATIVEQPLKGGERKTLVTAGSDARYLATGHLVYASGGTLLAVPFDMRRRVVTGGAISVLEGVSRPTSLGNGPATMQASMSSTGTLAYIPGPATSAPQGTTLIVVDQHGGIEPLKAPPRAYKYPRVSPDATRVAVEIDNDIWIFDIAGTTAIRNLTVTGHAHYPVWDGNDFVMFHSDREGERSIFRQRADGMTPAQRVTMADPQASHVPESVSHDRKTLLYDVITSNGHALWALTIADRKAVQIENARTGVAAISAAFSPDDKWIAYATKSVGGTQVFVEPYPPTGSKYPIGEQGTHPMWSRDGKQLSYEAQGLTFTVDVQTRPAFYVSTETSTARVTLFRASQESYRDSMPGGRYLGVAADPSGGLANPQIRVVQNFFEVLKQRVPGK